MGLSGRRGSSVVSCVLAALVVTGCTASNGEQRADANRPASIQPSVQSSAPASVTSPTPSASPTGSRPPVSVPGNAAVVRSDALRAAVNDDALQRTTSAIDALSVDLYRELAQKQGNVAFSPYSIAVALAMTRAGAVGRTASEMDTVLHAAMAGDLDNGFNALDQALAKRSGKYPYGYGPAGPTTVDLELATADQLWGQRGFPLEKAFLDRLAAYYGAGMRIVDYAGARDQARADINAWVAERTHDRIPELIPKGILDDHTRLVLTNAIYLKAKWFRSFAKAAPGSFYRADGSETRANLMALDTYMRYGKGVGYEAAQLSYVGGLSMILIVPDAGTFGVFESSLRDGARLRGIIDSLAPDYVRLRMPKFTFRSQSLLRRPLSDLGMPIAFTDDADFSAMSPFGNDMLLQEVVHETFIAVDEEGTEAAAATAVIGGATGGPSPIVDLTGDKAFIFLVRRDETGAILFIGRVPHPD